MRKRRSRLPLRRTPRLPRVALAVAAGDALVAAAVKTVGALAVALRELRLTAIKVLLSRPQLVANRKVAAEAVSVAVAKAAAEVEAKAVVAVVTEATVATEVPKVRATRSLAVADVVVAAAMVSRRNATERTGLMQIKVS